MSTTLAPTRGGLATALPARAAGAVLALAVAAVHVVDQGGFPGEKDPAYVGIGYYLIEAVGVAVAVALLAWRGSRGRGVLRLAWLGAAAVALGPLAGYLLSRGPGLPDYTDDKGAWSEPLGIVSLVVEVALLVLALAALSRSASRPRD